MTNNHTYYNAAVLILIALLSGAIYSNYRGQLDTQAKVSRIEAAMMAITQENKVLNTKQLDVLEDIQKAVIKKKK